MATRGLLPRRWNGLATSLLGRVNFTGATSPEGREHLRTERVAAGQAVPRVTPRVNFPGPTPPSKAGGASPSHREGGRLLAERGVHHPRMFMYGDNDNDDENTG